MGVGGIYGCGCRDFLILLIPIYSTCNCSFFTAASLLYVHKKMFFVLVPVLFVIKFYVLIK